VITKVKLNRLLERQGKVVLIRRVMRAIGLTDALNAASQTDQIHCEKSDFTIDQDSWCNRTVSPTTSRFRFRKRQS
jgi:hypothetical protein